MCVCVYVCVCVCISTNASEFISYKLKSHALSILMMCQTDERNPLNFDARARVKELLCCMMSVRHNARMCACMK
jgi:hypothetical protein